jgi:ribA/ribD-fused uncharacterized protein
MSTTKSAQKILFNARAKNYSFLSNDYISDITIDGKLYNHVEGYFQSSKHMGINDNLAERLRCILSPIVCKKISEKQFITDDKQVKWDQGYKLIVMKRAVLTKFITDQDLAKKLISTGTNELIYNAPDDDYWGNGTDDKGSNVLGNVLMETRDVIKNFPNDYE